MSHVQTKQLPLESIWILTHSISISFLDVQPGTFKHKLQFCHQSIILFILSKV